MMGPKDWIRLIAKDRRIYAIMDEYGVTYTEARHQVEEDEREDAYREWRAAVDRERQERDGL